MIHQALLLLAGISATVGVFALLACVAEWLLYRALPPKLPPARQTQWGAEAEHDRLLLATHPDYRELCQRAAAIDAERRTQ